MKKTVLAIAVLLGALAFEASAQKHLVFTKGVEIKGTKVEMVSALAKKGFTYEESNDGMPLLIGKFEGYSDSEINVLSRPGSDIACAIRAELPARLSWVKLVNDYDDMKKKLTKRFGKPAEVEESFADDPGESSEKLVSLINNRCTYRSVFSCDEGKVTLTLKHFGPVCFVCVLFEDALSNVGTTSL